MDLVSLQQYFSLEFIYSAACETHHCEICETKVHWISSLLPSVPSPQTEVLMAGWKGYSTLNDCASIEKSLRGREASLQNAMCTMSQRPIDGALSPEVRKKGSGGESGRQACYHTPSKQAPWWNPLSGRVSAEGSGLRSHRAPKQWYELRCGRPAEAATAHCDSSPVLAAGWCFWLCSHTN